MRNRKRTGWHRIINGVNISAFFVVVFVGIPLYWLIASSFKTPDDLGDSPPQCFPNPITDRELPVTPSARTTSASTSATRSS